MVNTKVEEFEEKDMEDFLRMSQLEYGTSVSTNSDHVRWKHLDSPLGASCCISLQENTQVVGRVLLQPRMLNTASKLYSVACVTDLLIDPKYRSTPVNFINLTKACGDAEKFDLVYHTCNERTFPLYSKLFRFANPFFMRAYGFPVRFSGLLARVIGYRINAIDWLAAPIRWFLVLISLAANVVGRLEISRRSITDHELDVLCAKCLRQSGPHLSRTNTYLRWRFSDAPLWSATVYRVEVKGKFIGYVVTRNVELAGLNHLVLMDFVLDVDTSLIARFGIRLWLIRQAIVSMADSLFTMANPSSNTTRKCVGFPLLRIPDRLLPHATPIFMRSRTEDSKGLELDGSMHFTLADLDYF